VQLEDIKIGANLEISIFRNGEKSGKSYPAKVQNVSEDKRIEIDVPFSGGQMILFHLNTIIEVITTNQEGVFSFKARVIERTKKSNVPVMIIKPETEIEKKQRRAYFRFPCNCNVRFRKFKLPALGGNDEQFKTTIAIDISGGGIAIRTEEKLDNEAFFECVIILDKDIEINTICKSVNVKKEDFTDKYWKTALKFEKITEQGREKIINFIFQEQLKLRRKGLV